MRTFRIAAVALATALSAACGSTVQVTSSQTALTTTGGGLGTSPSSATSGGASLATGGSTGGQPGGQALGTTTGGSGGTAQQPGSVAATEPLLRGTTRPTSMRVGVIYLKGLDQAYAALGASAKSSDSHADYEAVFRYLNAHGGAAGVRLVPTYFTIDASSTQSQATQVEAACQFFTSDHPVDVVVSYTRGSGLPTCLARKGIPLVNGFSEANADEGAFSSDPLYWEPSQLSLDALDRLLARSLAGGHYPDTRWPSAPSCATTKEPRIGVVTFDRPEWRAAYSRSLAPAFKAAGHPIYDVEYIAVSGSTAEQVSQASSGAQSAVLKFSSECVDHVVFVSNVVLDYLFMDVADQQRYRPRYGLSSLEAPPIVIGSLTDAAGQLHGAMGPGWSPYSDVGVTDFDATAKRPQALCLQILSAAGLAPTDNNSGTLALPACEGPLFVRALVTRWLSAAPGASLLSVVNSMGSTYQPVGTYTSVLSSGRHYGAASYRDFQFVDACGCFRYTSGLRPV